MAIEQAHEQNNATLKGDGGAIGLIQNESALWKWTLAGTEMTILVNQFEKTIPNHIPQDNDYSFDHE